MSAATATTIVEGERARRLSLRWIISGRDDLVWFIGSVISSYLMLLVYASGLVPLVPMLAAWAILIDAPHVFATFSRTYFDRTERLARKRLLWGSLAFFLVGPLMVAAGAALVFFFLAALWAYYHLVKQHYGFMVLYKKKNQDLAAVDNVLDRTLLLLAFTYPFVAFVAQDGEAMERVPAALRSSVNGLANLLLGATILVAIVWLGRQLQRALGGQPLNVPKYLLLGAAIPMHWVVLLTPMPHKPLAVAAILTVYHNLQYHRLVWFHNKKYGQGDDPSGRYGAAAFISRRFIYYIGFGLLFGLWYQGPRQYVLAYLLAHGEQESFWIQVGAAFLWGFAFIHYHLDSKIWRVRRDPSVGQALRLSE